MDILGLDETHVDIYRSVRLRALASDPDAFGSTFARESEFDEATWRTRLTSFAGRPGRVFLAVNDVASMAGAIGMVGVGLSELGDSAEIWGMWVAPEARGSGAGHDMLQAATHWAWEQRAGNVTLWVHRHNAPAIALYERDGFEAFDDPTVEAPDGCTTELCMRLRLVEPGAPDRITLSP